MHHHHHAVVMMESEETHIGIYADRSRIKSYPALLCHPALIDMQDIGNRKMNLYLGTELFLSLCLPFVIDMSLQSLDDFAVIGMEDEHWGCSDNRRLVGL
jgi:hypothetical protein